MSGTCNDPIVNQSIQKNVRTKHLLLNYPCLYIFHRDSVALFKSADVSLNLKRNEKNVALECRIGAATELEHSQRINDTKGEGGNTEMTTNSAKADLLDDFVTIV